MAASVAGAQVRTRCLRSIYYDMPQIFVGVLLCACDGSQYIYAGRGGGGGSGGGGLDDAGVRPMCISRALIV